MEVIAVAQISDAMRKRIEVVVVFVFASPARIGMNALTDGISLPIKIYQSP